MREGFDLLFQTMTERMDEIIARQNTIEAKLDILLKQRLVKDFYTVAEFAKLVGRDDYTVRQWVRRARVRGQKRPCGRGNSQEWMIPHAELIRYENEGLLPDSALGINLAVVGEG
jgi:hypothetical protein